MLTYADLYTGGVCNMLEYEQVRCISGLRKILVLKYFHSGPLFPQPENDISTTPSMKKIET